MAEPLKIPSQLKEPVFQALNWVNQERQSSYELTGIVGDTNDLNVGETFDLGLVLCDGEICAKEQIRFTPTGDSYQFSIVEDAAPDIPPLLDPPPGIRSGWLSEQLAKYEFVVLLYYRGLW